MSNQEIKETLKEIAEAPYGSYERNEAFDRVRDKGLGWLRVQATLIDQQANRIRQLETAIAIIDMHNGSINSFDEIEAIIKELGRGIDT